jgi:nucleoside-diphosphate-sugar epimerase
MEVEVLALAVTGTQNVLDGNHMANVFSVMVVSSVSTVIMNPKIPIMLSSAKTADRTRIINRCFLLPILSHDMSLLILTGLYVRVRQHFYQNLYCNSKTMGELQALAYCERTGIDVLTVCLPERFNALSIVPVTHTSTCTPL